MMQAFIVVGMCVALALAAAFVVGYAHGRTAAERCPRCGVVLGCLNCLEYARIVGERTAAEATRAVRAVRGGP